MVGMGEEWEAETKRGQFSERWENIMLGEGKVCCQKVVTSSQVREAKCNHDRDELMSG